MFYTMELQKIICLFLFLYNYLIGTIAVPVERHFTEQVDLSTDIRLARVNPVCEWCESSGGRCVMMNTNSGGEIICDYFRTPNNRERKRGLPKGTQRRHKCGSWGTGNVIPGWALFCVCRRITSCRRRAQPVLELGATVAPQPIALVGLDGPTIESYPKTIL
ncbi:uncharacterized protein LOC132057640 [Lycium ferocissimum]|uniref:uncharacterized protein LOC132057640 n=1 Tax=Lycium ferocissimum TaxID=112874 RepID=UPI0028163027|nr:uncharacterized protein LOC132057640 [Lycium ferocissimum]